MCLVKVREEEDIVVPYRPVRDRYSYDRSRERRSTTRVSRTSVVERQPSRSYVSIPSPRPAPIPAPQPVPIFTQPPPAPPPPAPPSPPPPIQRTEAHFVTVRPPSPASSISDRHSDIRSHSSGRHSDYYVTREREYRRERERREPSAERPRYESFRYIDAPPDYDRDDRYLRSDRSRARSRSRGPRYSYAEDDDPGYRTTRERISIHRDEGDGGRRRTPEYRR